MLVCFCYVYFHLTQKSMVREQSHSTGEQSKRQRSWIPWLNRNDHTTTIKAAGFSFHPTHTVTYFARLWEWERGSRVVSSRFHPPPRFLWLSLETMQLAWIWESVRFVHTHVRTWEGKKRARATHGSLFLLVFVLVFVRFWGNLYVYGPSTVSINNVSLWTKQWASSEKKNARTHNFIQTNRHTYTSWVELKEILN